MSQKTNKAESLLEGFSSFLEASPTPYHAVHNLTQKLEAAGFAKLREGESWDWSAGRKFYVTRQDSSLIAFRLASQNFSREGFHLVGSHSDSPCLKIKPTPELHSRGLFQLGVEVYGSPLLATWYDRDLSLAGKIYYQDIQGKLHDALVDFERPVAVIPNLAIHLDRKANEQKSIQRQKELAPLVLQTGTYPSRFDDLLRERLPKHAEKILSFDLSLYDTQAPQVLGFENQFLAASRLDNLLSCYFSVLALIESDADNNALVVCYDHEEVGSVSQVGAESPFLISVLQRIYPDVSSYAAALSKSFFISCDNAHGWHPNFPEAYEPNHSPLLNQGPAIKTNHNQRYATHASGAARFVQCCERAGVPFQHYVVRSDMACGSTIGPLTAANLGVATLDIGVPTLAMHSIRELAGVKDLEFLFCALREFFQKELTA